MRILWKRFFHSLILAKLFPFILNLEHIINKIGDMRRRAQSAVRAKVSRVTSLPCETPAHMVETPSVSTDKSSGSV